MARTYRTRNHCYMLRRGRASAVSRHPFLEVQRWQQSSEDWEIYERMFQTETVVGKETADMDPVHGGEATHSRHQRLHS
eukprot:13850071-Alexandrium_andersonii.AAC.1